MLLADIPTDFWGALIALMLAIKGYLDWRRGQTAAQKTEEVAQKADAVAVKVQTVADRVDSVADQHSADFSTLSDKVEDVHRATNGIVAKLETAAFAAGVKDEKDRESKQR